jgi:PPOX class probable F420-dependent enzyme
MSDFTALGDKRFVSLTTFRKTRVPVPTTVWIARDGDALLVTTPAESGKVKRLRNNPRVELRASSRLGKVRDDAPKFEGTTEIVSDEADVARYGNLFRRKLGIEYSIFMFIERRVAKGGNKERVILRILPS